MTVAQRAAGEFEIWLRKVCFQHPPPEAYDLAKAAYLAALQTQREQFEARLASAVEAERERCAKAAVEQFEDWYMLQSKMPYRTPKEIAEMAWFAAIRALTNDAPENP